nr:glycoside hydrolase [Oceanusvirus sp.]
MIEKFETVDGFIRFMGEISGITGACLIVGLFLSVLSVNKNWKKPLPLVFKILVGAFAVLLTGLIAAITVISGRRRTVRKYKNLPGYGCVVKQLDSIAVLRRLEKGQEKDGNVSTPSIIKLPNGIIVSTSDRSDAGDITDVFWSRDDGKSWELVSSLEGAFWCTVFLHQGALHLAGCNGHYGRLMVTRSDDFGKTWGKRAVFGPENSHRSATPVVVWRDRIWFCFDVKIGRVWPAFVMYVASAPMGSDITDPSSWFVSEGLEFPKTSETWWWNYGFSGFLEGNMVVGPDDRLCVMARVHRFGGGTAAVMDVHETGEYLHDLRFVRFPGGAVKFSVKRDEKTGLYWSLVNTWDDSSYPGTVKTMPFKDMHATRFRRFLTLTVSEDMVNWFPARTIIGCEPGEAACYADFDFHGEDMLCMIRCGVIIDGVVPEYPAATNCMGFLRIHNFRSYGSKLLRNKTCEAAVYIDDKNEKKNPMDKENYLLLRS